MQGLELFRRLERGFLDGFQQFEARFVREEPYFEVEVQEFKDVMVRKTPELAAQSRMLSHQFEQWSKLSKKVPPETIASVL